MSLSNVAHEIEQLKSKRDAIILAHNYEPGEVQDIADYVGDSFELSVIAAQTRCRIIVFCGVRFMAETAKILSPDKTVLMPRADAGCALAEMFTLDMLARMRREHPRAAVLSYVNTSAQVKAQSQVCCTSANAVAVAESIDADEIIFVPDRNLAHFVDEQVDKTIIPCGTAYCYVHDSITVEQLRQARQKHPRAMVLVHPECRPEVVAAADHVLSTGGMMRTVRRAKAASFIIVTEVGILHRMRKECPEKEFYTLRPVPVCKDMKLTRPEDVLRSLRDQGQEVHLEDHVLGRARHALDAMLAVGTPSK